MLAAATGWERAEIAAHPDRRLPVGASRTFGEMVRRRVRREPVAYILGRKGFRRIELIVDRRVLIPRPETELLVEVALEARPGTALDVGTGSGAIALAIADELPEARVRGIDTSLDALRVADANNERLGLSKQVDMVSGGVSSLPEAGFDLVVANLPYVSESEWKQLQPEIRDYEPHEAVVGGPTGLEMIDALTTELSKLDRRPSVLALEIGLGQGERVRGLVEAAGYREVEMRRDLAGIERVVVGRDAA